MASVSLPIELDPLIAEAKQRARRRRLLAAGVLALALAGTATGIVASQSSGGSGAVPWLPTKPNVGPANPPLAAPCTASDLRASLVLQGATMSLVGPITIVNRSSAHCSLLGRPRLSFAGATAKWRQTPWKQTAGDPFTYDPLAPTRGSLRALAPGEHVSVMLSWSNWCSTQSPSAIVLALPSGGKVRVTNAQNPRLSSPVCNGGAGSLSTLSATRFTPFVPTGPPSSALPLKASIVSRGPLTVKGKTLTQPSFVARPGSWLSYIVALRNTSDKQFRFGRTCPAYTEDWGGLARGQAYVLNCQPVGGIAPHASVRFAMRILVPRGIANFSAFGWVLAPHTYDAPNAMAVVDLR